jgi:hypothetical protein
MIKVFFFKGWWEEGDGELAMKLMPKCCLFWCKGHLLENKKCKNGTPRITLVDDMKYIYIPYC